LQKKIIVQEKEKISKKIIMLIPILFMSLMPIMLHPPLIKMRFIFRKRELIV